MGKGFVYDMSGTVVAYFKDGTIYSNFNSLNQLGSYLNNEIYFGYSQSSSAYSKGNGVFSKETNSNQLITAKDGAIYKGYGPSVVNGLGERIGSYEVEYGLDTEAACAAFVAFNNNNNNLSNNKNKNDSKNNGKNIGLGFGYVIFAIIVVFFYLFKSWGFVILAGAGLLKYIHILLRDRPKCNKRYFVGLLLGVLGFIVTMYLLVFIMMLVYYLKDFNHTLPAILSTAFVVAILCFLAGLFEIKGEKS